MNQSKKKRLEKKGWRVGSASEFLGLSDSETAFIELKLKLSQALKDKRLRQGITQVDLARALQSSQSRVAKMEAGDPSVSVDLLIRGLFAVGATRKELGRTIGALKET
jgi:DNA-binding XRE family transcriptional regulator